MRLVALFVLLAIAPRADAASDHARVEVRPLAAAHAVVGLDGARHVGYELLITNYHGDTGPLSLLRVDVFADAGTAPAAVFDGAGLVSRVIHPGRPGAAAGDAPVIGPPFRSGRWLAHQGPGNHRSAHWGSQLADGGRVTIPQRFAIDFIGLDDSGRTVRAEARRSANDDWVGFGAEVIAVEDGIVRDLQDDVADDVPLAPLPLPRSVSARGLYGDVVRVDPTRPAGPVARVPRH